MRTLGLIGGVTWVSTIEYYRLINQGVADRLGPPHSARCIINSYDFAAFHEFNLRQDWDAALELVSKGSLDLKTAGAEAIVLCANTVHVIADRLQDRIGLPVLHIVDATAAEIRRRGFDRIALLGTKYTMELAFFRDRLAWHGITAVIPNDADRAFINETIFAELGRNTFRDETRARYVSIIESLTKQGAQGAILGCTEIPLLVRQADTPVPVFDTTTLHANAAVDWALT